MDAAPERVLVGLSLAGGKGIIGLYMSWGVVDERKREIERVLVF